jgi:hypothetical protein
MIGVTHRPSEPLILSLSLNGATLPPLSPLRSPLSFLPPSSLAVSVYREELYEPLIECLKLLCHEESVILLGLTRSFAKPDFFHLMRAHGLRYTMVPMEALPASYYTETAGSNVGLFLGTIH